MPRAYECRGCKIRRPQPWEGPCTNPSCGRWYNSRPINVDEMEGAEVAPLLDGEVMSLQDAATGAAELPRIPTGIAGVDHVLGGGLVHDHAVLLCGPPGSGKSTLLLQILKLIARDKRDALYVSCEESMNQLGLRAKRMGRFPARLQAVHQTEIGAILDHLDEIRPDVFAVDSLQRVRVEEYMPGSTPSIEEAIDQFKRWAQREHAVAIVIGHVDKEGAIKGPRSLEHDVDVSLFLSGSEAHPGRTLRCGNKNRGGPTPRESRFFMRAEGLTEASEPETGPPPEPLAVAKPILPSFPKDTDRILATDCGEPECRGKKGRACTSADGTREAGFHPSRLARAKAGPRRGPGPREPRAE